ncbi:alcohol dehydrogenase [Aureococcus anophagefferens]|nr:alcohol dehydrogenase [Aureococcus anophagefferens]
MEADASVAVFGCGAVGLAVIQAAKIRGARRIFAVDTNPTSHAGRGRARSGWGVSVVIGVAAAGHEIATRPFQLVTGRTWKGTAFGGFKSRDEVPELVDRVLAGDLPIDAYITHNFDGVDNTHAAIDALHGGDCAGPSCPTERASPTPPSGDG